MSTSLLSEVELFLKLTGMKPSSFGRAALGDPALITRMRAGRKMWSETEARVRDFMHSYAEDA